VGKTIMGAVVSLDGFMADDNDGVGPLFDRLGNAEGQINRPSSTACMSRRRCSTGTPRQWTIRGFSTRLR
jgi:hypothetical protein